MIKFRLDGRCSAGRNDPAFVIADRVDDEQDSTFSFADRLEPDLALVARVPAFKHRSPKYETGEPEIKAPVLEIAVTLGGIPDQIGWIEAPPNAPETSRHQPNLAETGGGREPGGLNFGDCFAYEVAKEHACRLLYVGSDFAKTAIASVL
jgi:uncharacterized protein with PIN domain